MVDTKEDPAAHTYEDYFFEHLPLTPGQRALIQHFEDFGPVSDGDR